MYKKPGSLEFADEETRVKTTLLEYGWYNNVFFISINWVPFIILQKSAHEKLSYERNRYIIPCPPSHFVINSRGIAWKSPLALLGYYKEVNDFEITSKMTLPYNWYPTGENVSPPPPAHVQNKKRFV